jgi:hypothetical protein
MWKSSLARATAKITAIPAGKKAWRSRAETGTEVTALAMVNENSLKNRWVPWGWLEGDL